MGLIRLFKNDLAAEIRKWTEKGLISTDQAAAICREYGMDFHDTDQRSRGYWILVFLGYLFIGMALITLISANWDNIPRALRMGGLIGITLAAHLAGLHKFRQGKDTAAVGLFFLGALCYGASIMLIAQIYHIGEHFPDGILIWALGVLPLALLLQSRALMLQTMTLGTLWFFVESHLGYFPWYFFIFLSAAVWHLVKSGASRTLFLWVIIMTGIFAEYGISWGLDGWQHLDIQAENLFFAGGWVLFCYGASKYLVHRDNPDAVDYGTLLALWCLRFFIVTLFIFSFEGAWEEVFDMDWRVPGAALAGGLSLAGAALVLTWLGNRRTDGLTVTAIISLLYLLSLWASQTLTDTTPALYFAVADNIALVSSGVWLIVSGIKNSISHYFFLGVVTILLTGLVRYVDLVGDYIGAAALFLGFAVILLATARFWKSRTQNRREKRGTT
ncbi:MAG TPA: DUF2157 domain-containing protein [Desulfobacteraceae bacterium]|nr:DUF2157 domain-containing protein [Desulfobacteraceae bacterium]